MGHSSHCAVGIWHSVCDYAGFEACVTTWYAEDYPYYSYCRTADMVRILQMGLEMEDISYLACSHA